MDLVGHELLLANVVCEDQCLSLDHVVSNSIKSFQNLKNKKLIYFKFLHKISRRPKED